MMSIRNFFGHLSTITRHRHMVIRHCFKAGIFWQGCLHDLSKYSPKEFFAGVRYFHSTGKAGCFARCAGADREVRQWGNAPGSTATETIYLRTFGAALPVQK